MNVPLLFSLLTGVITLSGYIVYNRGIFLGTCKPQAVSWALWTMATILNLASYLVMTDDLLKASLSIVSSIACLFTFICALYKKNYKPLSAIDGVTLGIGIISALAWWQFHSAVCANIILQFAVIAGFIPTYQSVWKDPRNENLATWILFSFAYLSLSITVLLRWNGNIPELIFPLLGLTLHSALAFLIVFRRCIKKR